MNRLMASKCEGMLFLFGLQEQITIQLFLLKLSSAKSFQWVPFL